MLDQALCQTLGSNYPHVAAADWQQLLQAQVVGFGSNVNSPLLAAWSWRRHGLSFLVAFLFLLGATRAWMRMDS